MPDHSMLKQLCSNLASFIICSTLLSGCSDSINNKQINETQSTHKPEVSEQLEQSTSEETISPASAFFIALVDEHFSELLKESKNLNTNLIAFTKKPAYVTLGFHALELILKGSNLKRTASDFAPLTSTNDTSTAPAELRRTLYAILLASEIENDISLLKQTWEAKLKNQLQHNTIAQANKFFLALHLKVEKELLGMPSKQVITEGNHLKPDEHFNLESLLEKLASLKNIENGS